MTSTPPFDPERVITVLDASRPTFDLDVVPADDSANLDRLATALRSLGARLRVEGLSDDEARALPVPLDGRWLADQEISTWQTDAGQVDVLTHLRDRDGRPGSSPSLLPNP